MGEGAPRQRPRVLQVGPDMRGGMTAMISRLLESPLAERYELDFVATHRGPDPLGRRLVIFAGALWRIASWSLRRRGRIVHVHATVRGSLYRKAVCVALARALRRRVIFHLHSGPGDIRTYLGGLGRPGRVLLGATLRGSNAVLAVSRASATALEAVSGARDVLVVPNAAPSGPTAPDRWQRQGPPLAIYIGGFENPVKGGAEMLAALRAPALAGLRMTMAGPGELPPAGEQLLAGAPNLAWRGWLEDAEREQLMRDADVFVLPSTSEGLPLALLEAMAEGLAIVATDVGGVPDVLSGGRDALLVAPGDPEGLALAVAEVAGDPALRERLGRAARERAGRLNAEEVTGRLGDLYARLLG